MSLHRYNLLLECIRLVLGAWLRWKFRLKVKSIEVLKSMKPPYVIVPNHSNTFDPFFIAIHIKEPVYWVTSDANFRSSWVRFWLEMVGAIPKTKKISDLESVRTITAHIKRGGIVGIFAEGDRTWDGKTLPLIQATAKLIRMMKVPVLCPVLEGAFVSLPRWSKQIRRGQLTVDFSNVLYPDEYQGKSPGEVYSMLSRLIEHDDYAWQTEQGIPFVSKKGAESLESVLFLCRSCGSINTLHSSGIHFDCGSCGTDWVHSDMSRLIRIDNGVDDGTPGDWFGWQKTVFADRLASAYQNGAGSVLFTDHDVQVFKGFKFQNGEVLGVGEASFAPDGMSLSLIRNGPKGGLATTLTLFFPIEEISGQNVVFMNQFEFYYKDILYSFTYPKAPGCGIKWVQAIDCIQAMHSSGNADEKFKDGNNVNE